MKTIKWFLLLSAVLMTTHFACGHRTRDVSSGYTNDDVAAELEKLSQSGKGPTTGLEKAIALVKNESELTLYFASAPGDMGPVHAVAPIDLSILSEKVSEQDLESIQIYFFDVPKDDGHLNYLIIAYKTAGSDVLNYDLFTNEGETTKGSFTDKEFTSILKGTDGSKQQILVRSFDYDPSDDSILAPVIQLELNEYDDATAQEGKNLGQISSMEGFSGYL